MDRWKVTVVFDQDGTDQVEIYGWRVASKLWTPPRPGPTRCLVRAYDEDGNLVRSFQSSSAWSIDRVRVDG